MSDPRHINALPICIFPHARGAKNVPATRNQKRVPMHGCSLKQRPELLVPLPDLLAKFSG